MNFEILKSRRAIIIAVSIILIFIVAGVLIYFKWINKKEEISTQPININDTTVGALDEVVNQTEEISENIVEENTIEQNVVEANTQNNNSAKQNTNSNIIRKTNNIPYYIKVNYGAQVVTVYGKDESGNYTKPVKAMICSTGVATPKSGVYSIPARWEWLVLKGGVWGQYSTQIVGDILFHSVPYLRKADRGSLEYWEYDKLGTYASAGCIRLTVSDAKWIYNNCANGTKVEFYSSSNPGPLGKPSAKKISSYPDYLRNWDPTDPNSSNPWKTYKEPVKQETGSNQTENSGASNSGTNNSGANNSGTNNSGANNSGTNNSGASNSGTNNSGTNNSGASNSGANNSGTNNSGANNSGANNSGTNNSGANNSGTNNSDVNNNGTTNTNTNSNLVKNDISNKIE